jgi:predicted nucleic acid-binding protein
MTIVYLDSSALVKLVLPEPGSDLIDEIWDRAETVTSARLALPEVCAALAAAHRAARLAPNAWVAALREWESFWPNVRPVELTASVCVEASRLAAVHSLSGADAVHLASALQLGPDAVMVTWDRRLHAAASAEHLAMVPATLSQA